ncbi:CAMK protein kinase [Podila verticillata NRRL 6337]|nr:CAMK protein kinase [Podila verticillata NRRL 6337]
MTFSNPQPIPSRSSLPATHHRPTFRRSQSHNLTTSATTTSSSSSTPNDTSKYSFFVNPPSQVDTIYDDDDDEDHDEDETYGRPHDSGHYTSDMDDYSSLGIPIGKPGFYSNFFSSSTSSGGDMRPNNLPNRSQLAPGSNYAVPFGAKDGHHSINLLAHNTNDDTPHLYSKTTPIDIPSPSSTFAIVSSTSSTTSSPSHAIKIPQRTAKSSTEAKSSNNTTTQYAHAHVHPHYSHPNITIDTSKARLQRPPVQKTTSREDLPLAQKTVAPSSSSFPTKVKQGQLALGLKKDVKDDKDKDKASSSPYSTFAAFSTSSTTRPMMMGNPSRSSSALPPAPTLDTSSVLLPSLSPSSSRANSALVNSLEQLSVSWKAPEHTPTFPINRLHRSRTMSSGTRPYTNTSSFSSNSSDSTTNFPNYISPPSAMVTSSSYSSLPYSPAVAFLSNFVEATAPRMAPDEEGEQVGDFIMGKVIGHGGFSVVREAFAIHMDGMVARVAVKVVKKSQPGAADNDRVQRMLDKEVAIWSRLSHPNVLPFVAVEKLPTSTFVFCELCTGGQLLDYLTKNSTTTSSGRTGLDECQAREIFNQIAEAVRYLHEEKRIVHRDIKLENVLQHEDGTWKICDFGLAEYQNDEAALYFGSPLSPTIYNPRANASQEVPGDSPIQSSDNERDHNEEEDDEVGGSLAYCSPEQLRSQKPLRCPSSDVWSLGVVLYALLTGRLPFQDEYEPRLQYQILNGRYEDPTECSAEARELLKNMFRAKPEDRWKIGQVMDSPWCTGTVQETTGFANTGMGGFFSSFRA